MRLDWLQPSFAGLWVCKAGIDSLLNGRVCCPTALVTCWGNGIRILGNVFVRCHIVQLQQLSCQYYVSADFWQIQIWNFIIWQHQTFPYNVNFSIPGTRAEPGIIIHLNLLGSGSAKKHTINIQTGSNICILNSPEEHWKNTQDRPLLHWLWGTSDPSLQPSPPPPPLPS